MDNTPPTNINTNLEVVKNWLTFFSSEPSLFVKEAGKCRPISQHVVMRNRKAKEKIGVSGHLCCIVSGKVKRK